MVLWLFFAWEGGEQQQPSRGSISSQLTISLLFPISLTTSAVTHFFLTDCLSVLFSAFFLLSQFQQISCLMTQTPKCNQQMYQNIFFQCLSPRQEKVKKQLQNNDTCPLRSQMPLPFKAWIAVSAVASLLSAIAFQIFGRISGSI